MKKKLRKPCKRCDEMFRPTGKSQKICEYCQEKAFRKSLLKRKNISICK